ncbi:hypothetical protein, partial [Klebsiella pneumoniae]|uniref:hypothetical protein n=1 Tax=Klebsiella pneumoniae TaxID=573 RepID=UPI001D0E7CBD
CNQRHRHARLQLNNGVVLAHIADSKRHNPDYSDIIEIIPLDRFSTPGDERAAINFHDSRCF